jgi:hypothetical protein
MRSRIAPFDEFGMRSRIAAFGKVGVRSRRELVAAMLSGGPG